MIEFRKIENSSDLLFSKIYELYLSTFPAAERRNLDSLEQILNCDKNFEMDALMRNGDFVGFFDFWAFEHFTYVEHFAVSSKMRGQNIGSEVVKTFLSRINLPVVLEVEMPQDEQSIRRVGFYERLGFKVLSHDYAQPYYDGSGKLLPMLLMSNDHHFAEKHFGMIKNTLYRDVYRYSP
ncbi:MAG: GNAT family N-acetyltransferase [Rikenellaceae bacterium]|nr:GNAT family N-acetyltransferase [Rikenellaceae bacterium]MCL2692220.1 GNAT family N-acetyltransferase [Rikenellaceae bacterium]